MGLLNRIWGWIAAAGVALIAGMAVALRWQADKIERRDEEIRRQTGWIDTTKRIQSKDAPMEPDEAKAWLKRYSDEGS